MPLIIIEPNDDAVVHPAYRPMMVDVCNTYSDQSKCVGIHATVYIYRGNTLIDTRELYTKKYIGLFAGLIKMYRFDFQNIMQDYLSFNYNTINAAGDKIDDDCQVWFYARYIDVWLDTDGLQNEDALAYGLTFSEPVVVLNATRQHEEWIDYGTNLHFTMAPFTYNPLLHFTTRKFLTNKTEMNVCLLHSEYVGFHGDKADAYPTNAYELKSYDASGTVLGWAVYDIQAYTTANPISVEVNTNGRRSIGIGPSNINSTAWTWVPVTAPNAAPVINGNVAYYTIRLAHHLVIASTHFVFWQSELKTYHVTSCCADDVRFHFLNAVGEIDSVTLLKQNEAKKKVKSTTWEKGLSFPHSIPDYGSQRLSSDAGKGLKFSKIINSQSDADFMFELTRTPMCMMQKGTDYVPVVVKDAEFDDEPKDNGVVEYEIEFDFANGFITQRN